MKESKKVRLHQICIEQLAKKIASLERTIQDTQKAAQAETKSSAGDKFETTREMMKQEMDKNGVQLSQAREMLSHLQQLDPHLKNDRVSYGCLAHTNEGIYYFAVSFGKVVINDQSYFVLSMASPIGKALRNRKAGEEVAFMGRKIRIEEII
jgi:transcription elongation GreA/GreB family factor